MVRKFEIVNPGPIVRAPGYPMLTIKNEGYDSMAGYSKRSLIDKLGIKQGHRVAILGAPPDYLTTLGELPPRTIVGKKLKREMDFLHFFTKSHQELANKFAALKSCLAQNGMLWISWPKGSSGVATDLNDNVVREIGLSNGLVDVKVCAVDETWSGLKFVYRVKDRK